MIRLLFVFVSFVMVSRASAQDYALSCQSSGQSLVFIGDDVAGSAVFFGGGLPIEAVELVRYPWPSASVYSLAVPGVGFTHLFWMFDGATVWHWKADRGALVYDCVSL